MHEHTLAGDLLEITQASDPLIARVHAPAVRERQARSLQEGLLTLADDAGGRIVLDLTGVQQLTSAGVNALVQGQDRCRKLDGRLVLIGLSHDLIDLFKVTGLDRTLTIASHIDDAVVIFSRRPSRKLKLRRPRAA